MHDFGHAWVTAFLLENDPTSYINAARLSMRKYTSRSESESE